MVCACTGACRVPPFKCGGAPDWSIAPNAVFRNVNEMNAALSERDRMLGEAVGALQELCDTLGECGMTDKARAFLSAYDASKKWTDETEIFPVTPAAVAVPDDVDLWAFCRDVLKRGAAIESQFAQQGYETFIAEIEHAARKEDKRLRALLSAQQQKKEV